MKAKHIFFDLEGPLSPQDNAFDLMHRAGAGQIFRLISRYDDLLALEGRAGYEPGDTLALIVPFLVRHGVTEADIERAGRETGLVPGAKELIESLRERGWRVFCISTSYEQYARMIGERLGLNAECIACTSFPLDAYRRDASAQEMVLVDSLERALAGLEPERDDAELKALLDRFYWEELPLLPLGRVLREVKPVGGRRKVQALRRFLPAGLGLDEAVAVGDSITDAAMLEAVDEAGGLAIAFNANEYALPHATAGLASTHLSDLAPLLEAWEQGSREGARRAVEERERAEDAGDRGQCQWLKGRKDMADALRTHKRLRALVRRAAASLG